MLVYLIALAIGGLFTGALARLALPGPDPMSLLSTMLVKEMRSSLGEGFFGKGPDGDVYGGWLDESVGKALADRDALHLEGVLKESLERKAAAAEGAP